MRALRLCFPALLSTLLAACTSILGVEDLHEGELPGGSNVGGTGGGSGGSSQGTSGAQGTSGIEANGGAAGTAILEDGSAGNGGAIANDASTGSPDAMSDASASGSIEGIVIDYWRHPIPAAPMTLGAQSTITGADGKFKFAAATPPYDITVALGKSVTGSPYSQGWLFQGLTRKDPTLQIYRAFAAHGGIDSAAVNSTIAGVTFPLPATRSIKLAFGSADGTFQWEPDSNPYASGDSDWRGPPATKGTLHALLWNHTGTATLAPPTTYAGYDSGPLTVTAGASVAISLDVRTMGTIASAPVSGTVTTSSPIDRENDAYVVFTSNAIMQIVSEASPAAAFSYVMPTLPQASITVSAARGNFYLPPFALVHEDNIAPGKTGVALAIPDPPTLLTPFDNATGLTEATEFSWNSGGKVAILAFRFDDRQYYVVTTASKAKIPKFAIAGLELPAKSNATWSVEVHGLRTTVDDATGPSGGLDPFAAQGTFWGPPRGSGSYLWSEERYFSTP